MAEPRTRCILVRHGQTPANVDGRLDTAVPGLELTQLGYRQAAALPEALRSESVARIAVSPLQRTGLTAQPLARDRELPPIQISGLEEISAGSLEMRGDDEAKLTYLETGFAWAAGDLERIMPGGSSGREFFERYDRAIGHLIAQDGTTVVISHGVAIRVWLAARANNVDVTFASEHALGNTGRVTIEGNAAVGWEVISWDSQPAGMGKPPNDARQDPTGASLDALRAEAGREH